MNLEEAEELAIQTMKEHGLIDGGWTFGFHTAISSLGKCHLGKRHISLSKSLVELNTKLKIYDILLHEIAHALVGIGHTHDRVWKNKAKEIGCNALSSATDSIVPPSKFVGVCKNGHEHQANRRTKSSCGICSRRFSPEYVIEWKRA